MNTIFITEVTVLNSITKAIESLAVVSALSV